MPTISRLVLALLLALTGGLAACSDDGGGSGVDLQDREESDAADDEPTDDGDTDDEPTDDETDGDTDEPTDGDTDEPTDDETDDPSDDGGELPAEAGPYIDALAATFAEDESLPVPADDARCLSERMVRIAGFERLVDAGVTPEAFAEDADLGALGLPIEAGLAAFDSFEACGIDLRELMIESFSADATDPEETRACIEAALPADELREIMARGFVEGDEFDDSPEAEAFFGGLFACAFGSLEG